MEEKIIEGWLRGFLVIDGVICDSQRRVFFSAEDSKVIVKELRRKGSVEEVVE